MLLCQLIQIKTNALNMNTVMRSVLTIFFAFLFTTKVCVRITANFFALVFEI